MGCFLRHCFSILIEFSFSKLSKRLSFKRYRHVYIVFKILFYRLTPHCFPADSTRKQTSFHTHRVCAVCDVTQFFSPTALDSITAEKRGVFAAFKRWAGWRTSFCLSQMVHLYGLVCRIFCCLDMLHVLISRTQYKVCC